MFCYGIAKLCICFIHGAAEIVGVKGHSYVNGCGGIGAIVLVGGDCQKKGSSGEGRLTIII